MTLREVGGRRWTSVALVLAATMALIGAACTPPPPPAGTDVVMSASQQPDGLANYQNLVVLNTELPDSSPGSWLDVIVYFKLDRLAPAVVGQRLARSDAS